MKNRLLPSCLSALLLGLTLLLFSNLTFATGPGKIPGDDRIQKMRINQVTGTVDPADVMKARLQLEQLQTKSTAGLGLSWESKGPNNFCGRSLVTIFDNRDTSGVTLYTGGVSGGVWKSTNMGLTWNPASTGSENVLNVSAMVQLASGTIFVGTGDWYCGAGNRMGSGIYKSEDGINFTLIPGAAPVANDPSTDYAFIMKLAVNSLTGRLFAITNLGIRYSDNGTTWNILKNGDASDVVVGPDGMVLMAVNDSVFISASGNLASFVNVSAGTSTTLPTDNVGKIELAVAPSDANVLYASIAKESDGLLLNVYRSTDKGATWAVIFPSNPTYEPFEGGVGCAANTLAVFPADPYKILLGGYNFWYGEQILPSGYYSWERVSDGMTSFYGQWYVPYNQYDCVFDPSNPSKVAIASDNGITIGTYSTAGMAFQTTNKNLITTQMNSVAYSIHKDAVMGGGKSIGVQVIGALTSNDPKAGVDLLTPIDWMSGTYCEWSMIHPTTVFFGTDYFLTDTETVPYYRSDDMGGTFSPTFLGGITSTIADLLPIKYWENFDYLNTRDTVTYYAGDTIAAGDIIQVESSNVKYKFPYTCPVNLMPGDSILVPDVVQSRLFIYGTKSQSGIFMTKDALKFSVDPTWFQLGETDPIVCMALSEDLNYLWAGTETGKLYRLSNIALAYNAATADYHNPTCIVATESFSIPEFSGRYITSIAISPNDNNTVLVTLGNYGNSEYLYLTQNALDSLPSFTSVQGDLPSTPVFSSLFEMHGGNKVIVGTDMGIFTTDNIFTGTWTTDYTGLGNLPVTMLRQQTMNHSSVQNFGTIYAASYGNGLFIDNTFWSPLGTDPVTANPSDVRTLKVVPNPASGRVTVSYTLEGQTDVVLSVYDLTGRQIMNRQLGSQSAGDHSATVDLSGLNTGTYLFKVNDARAKVVKIQ